MYSKFNMNIIFEGYVSCVMFPVLCVLLYVSCWINNDVINVSRYCRTTVELWSHSVGRLENNRDWWRASDVSTVT